MAATYPARQRPDTWAKKPDRDAHRSLIEQLYKELSLAKTRSVMESEYGFEATSVKVDVA